MRSYITGDRVETMQGFEILTGTVCNRIPYRDAGYTDGSSPPANFVCVEWDNGNTRYVDPDALDYEEYDA